MNQLLCYNFQPRWRVCPAAVVCFSGFLVPPVIVALGAAVVCLPVVLLAVGCHPTLDLVTLRSRSGDALPEQSRRKSLPLCRNVDWRALHGTLRPVLLLRDSNSLLGEVFSWSYQLQLLLSSQSDFLHPRSALCFVVVGACFPYACLFFVGG